jgi:putative PIN family toxin of toxin-antitoxin system
VSHDLLRLCADNAFELFISEAILAETERVLRSARIRKKYTHSDDDIRRYLAELARLAIVLSDVPAVRVVRDPADDMVVGCAIAASAEYLVSRDKDLLSLGSHDGIGMITPETFLGLLRSGR